MSTPKAFSIITPDGNPDSMKIITEGNWNGEMVFCSRERYLTARNEPRYKQQLERPGVYILIGASDDSSFPKIYVGEGDPINTRLSQHDVKKDFWDALIYVTSLNNTLDKVPLHNPRDDGRRRLGRNHTGGRRARAAVPRYSSSAERSRRWGDRTHHQAWVEGD